MKKLQSILSLVLLLGFLSSTTGINVYKHYCGDFLAEISFFVKSNPCADENGEESCSASKETDFCEDESEFYQLDTQLIKESYGYQKIELTPFQLELVSELFIVAESASVETEIYVPPPLINKEPLYQKNQQLVFYG